MSWIDELLGPRLHPLMEYLDLAYPEPWMPPGYLPFESLGVDSNTVGLYVPAPEREGAWASGYAMASVASPQSPRLTCFGRIITIGTTVNNRKTKLSVFSAHTLYT